MLHVRKVHIQRRIDRRMRPVPRVVGAVIAVEHIVSGFLEDADRFFGFLQRSADLLELLARHCAFIEAAGHRTDRIPDRNGEIVPAHLLYLLHDLACETQPVFKAPAVFVLTVIGIRHRELIEKIALVNGMDLHSVGSGLFAQLCGAAEGIDEFRYHFTGEMIHLYARIPDVGLVRIRRGPPPFGGEKRRSCRFQETFFHKRTKDRRQQHRSARAYADLEEDLCSAVMDLADDRLNGFKHFRMLVDPLLADDADKRDQTRDEQADIIVLPVAVEFSDIFDEAALCFPLDHVRSFHREHDYAVLDLNVSDLPRAEQRFVFRIHRSPCDLELLDYSISNNHPAFNRFQPQTLIKASRYCFLRSEIVE